MSRSVCADTPTDGCCSTVRPKTPAGQDSAKLYLSTDHAGLYEKWGFRYLGQGYHPWGAESRIYERTL